jgi:hypothetical protein
VGVGLYLVRRRQRWLTIAGVSAIAVHTGSVIALDTGSCGVLMIAVLTVFLPVGDRGVEHAAVKSLGRRASAWLVSAAAVLALATVEVAPVKWTAQRLGHDRTVRVIEWGADHVLAYTGDKRTNNVLPEFATRIGYTFETSVSRPGSASATSTALLFDCAGRRAGPNRSYRVFSAWIGFGQSLAAEIVHHNQFPAQGWQGTLRQLASPLLARDVGGALHQGDRVEIYFRAWSIPRRHGPMVVARPRVHLASVSIGRTDLGWTFDAPSSEIGAPLLPAGGCV